MHFKRTLIRLIAIGVFDGLLLYQQQYPMQGEQQPTESPIRKKVKRDNHRGATHFQSTNQLMSLYRTAEQTPIRELSVIVSDPTKPNKYFSSKTLQNLLLWFLTDKAHNPLWLTVKNQSKMEHLLLLSFEIEQSIFFDELNGNRLEWIKEVFDPTKKAEFRDSNIQANFFEKLLSTAHHNAIVPNESEQTKSKQPLITTGMTTDEIIYQRYRQYILSEDELRDNLYPNQRLTLYKDYTRMTLPAPAGARACDRILCMDCQMVTTKAGFELAKISVVNLQYELLYDSLVVPENEVLNYNTPYSGLTKQIMDKATKTLQQVKEELRSIIYSDSILVGHSLENDLNSLRMLHDLIIDTAVMYLTDAGRKLSLKFLTEAYLKLNIQAVEHDSIEDAMHTIALARMKVDVIGRLESPPAQIEYDVLDQLIKAGNSVLLVCPNTPKFSKHKVSIEEVSLTEPPQHQTDAILKHLTKEPSKLTISQFRYGKIHASWQDYYRFLDTSLKAIYDACRPKTLFLLNFEPNKSVPSEGINIKPFCLFTSK